ncbi:DUF1214 domain-containing protein [Pseudoduganella namucuonensis]|uniref:DUF1214 domain-containing protein n=1 Tax=Pseudoduganella namucuonensis TaxID=1035707 RepID=A0A1I7M5U8_9BURK|nr:DUF1214 domain-containing protein [Pseudoduganella namucuonensis]SFV17305.1 Protein of unknown function [Pseudoduganella namucuonensis]
MDDSAMPGDDVGRAWERFGDIVKRAGAQITRPEAPSDAFSRAEGYRYLSRLLRIGLEMYVESGDPDFPVFIVPSHETAKIGADNPDNLYQVARISGAREYRVMGQRGSVAYLNFSTKSGGYDSNGKLEPTGFIDAHRMRFEADGSFELILSARPHAGNWLPLAADTSQLLIRQTFLDRRAEQPARLRIERIDAGARPAALAPARLADNLLKAAHFVENTARLFADWAQGFQRHANALPPADQMVCRAAGGDPNVFFYHSFWSLEEDEALLIEVARIPDCDYWNIQVNNYWMESLDYRYFDICLNKHSAVLNPDGSLTLVLAHADPGLPNWLETAGHRVGTMCFRWIGAPEQVHPLCRVVKLTELKGNTHHG